MTVKIDVNKPLIDIIQERVPHLRTQAQMDILEAALEAVLQYHDCVYGNNLDGAERLRPLIDKTLDLPILASSIGSKLEGEPEAATSEAAQSFKSEAFEEVQIQHGLLAELEELASSSELAQWYSNSRADRDKVVSQSLRDELYDAIRDKKKDLST